MPPKSTMSGDTRYITRVRRTALRAPQRRLRKFFWLPLCASTLSWKKNWTESVKTRKSIFRPCAGVPLISGTPSVLIPRPIELSLLTRRAIATDMHWVPRRRRSGSSARKVFTAWVITCRIYFQLQSPKRTYESKKVRRCMDGSHYALQEGRFARRGGSAQARTNADRGGHYRHRSRGYDRRVPDDHRRCRTQNNRKRRGGV